MEPADARLWACGRRPGFAASPENRPAGDDGRTITAMAPVWEHLAPGQCLRGNALCGSVFNRIGRAPAGAEPPRHTRAAGCNRNRTLVPGRARKLVERARLRRAQGAGA